MPKAPAIRREPDNHGVPPSYSPERFAADLLDRLGIRPTRGAMQALIGWQRAEGGHWKNTARFNPLNTTQDMPGSGDTGSQGNISVYRDWDQGLNATVRTLRNGRYGGILSALEAGDPTAVARAIESSPWGTSGDLVSRVIAGTKAPRVVRASTGSAAGNTRPAAGRQLGVSAAPAAPAAQPPRLAQGQPGDYLSLVSSLVSGPTGEQPKASAGPAVAPVSAGPPMPEGFRPATPSPVRAPGQESTVSQALGLLEGRRGTGPTFEAFATTEGANGSEVEPPAPIVETVSQARTGPGPQAALGWAKSYLGFRESGENQGGIASYANKKFGMSGQPWCAMFTSLAITKGGAPLKARTASVYEVRRQAEQGGGGYQRGFIRSSRAKAGDLILFGNDHIGMVDRVEGGRVHYVGGNQSDGVTMASVPVGHGDIVRPLYGARSRR